MARRKHHEEHESHERWLVSYADFITLLFAFFVVLYATSEANQKKQEEFQDSIKQQFAGFIGIGAGSQVDELDDPRKKLLIKPPIEGFPPAGSGTQEVEEYVEKRLEKDLPADEREAAVGGVNHDAIGVKIQLAANRLFASGSADLKGESALALDKIGRLLRDANRRIIVEGHTDDTPIKSEKFPSNWELSAARATKIARYLIARHKIPASQIIPVAYADQKPIAPNTDEAGRARNRRIEIKIVTGNASF